MSCILIQNISSVETYLMAQWTSPYKTSNVQQLGFTTLGFTISNLQTLESTPLEYTKFMLICLLWVRKCSGFAPPYDYFSLRMQKSDFYHGLVPLNLALVGVQIENARAPEKEKAICHNTRK